MLLPGALSKGYQIFIKAQAFLSKIKNTIQVVETIKDSEINKILKRANIKSDSKISNYAKSIFNSSHLNDKVKEAVSSVPFDQAAEGGIDSIISYVMDKIDSEARELSSTVISELDSEFPFIDTDLENLKDEVYKVLVLKVNNSLVKAGKLVKLNFKAFNYNSQIKIYTEFVEKMVQEQIKQSTIIIPPGQIIVVTSPTGGPATNAVPLVLSNVIK